MKYASLEELLNDVKDVIELDGALYPNEPPLSRHQRLLYKACEEHRFVWVEWPRGSAKSYTMGRRALTKKLQSRRKFIYTGPSYRQSRHPFRYEKQIIYNNDLLSTLSKDITENNEKSEIVLRNGSSSVALPASGTKIHGERGTDLILTEFFDYPKELYLRTVKPMLAVRSRGTNRVIWETTAGFEFQFAYEIRQHVLAEVAKGNSDYHFLAFDIEDLKGFAGFNYNEATGEWDEQQGWPFDWGIVESDRALDEDIWKQQYMNIWLRVTGSFYQFTVLKQEDLKRGLILRGRRDGKMYAAGLDTARSLRGNGDDSTFAVWEMDARAATPPAIVFTKRWNDVTADALARDVARYLKNFDVSMLVMDYRGGGVAVFDKLRSEYGFVEVNSNEPGRRIIMEFPSTAAIINEGHQALRSAFESKSVLTPARPEEDDDDLKEAYDTIDLGLKQLADLHTEPLPSGYYKFSAPPGRRKDIGYSVMYGYYAARQLMSPPQPEKKPRSLVSLIPSRLSQVLIMGDESDPMLDILDDTLGLL